METKGTQMNPFDFNPSDDCPTKDITLWPCLGALIFTIIMLGGFYINCVTHDALAAVCTCTLTSGFALLTLKLFMEYKNQ